MKDIVATKELFAIGNYTFLVNMEFFELKEFQYDL